MILRRVTINKIIESRVQHSEFGEHPLLSPAST